MSGYNMRDTTALNGDGKKAQRVFLTGEPGGENGISFGTGLLEGVSYDDAQLNVGSSTSTVDVWDFFLATVLQATLEITYENASQDKVIRARRI